MRLNNGSFRQNDVFHTSGNRYIPIVPTSILGPTISFKNSILGVSSSNRNLLQAGIKEENE